MKSRKSLLITLWARVLQEDKVTGLINSSEPCSANDDLIKLITGTPPVYPHKRLPNVSTW